MTSNFEHEISALKQHIEEVRAEMLKQAAENEALRSDTVQKYERVQKTQERISQLVDNRQASIRGVSDEIQRQDDAIQSEKAAALKQLERQKVLLDEAQAQLEAEHDLIKQASEEAALLVAERQAVQSQVEKYQAALSEATKVDADVTGDMDLQKFLGKYQEILKAHNESFELKTAERKQLEALIEQTASLTAEKAQKALILIEMEAKLRRLQAARK